LLLITFHFRYLGEVNPGTNRGDLESLQKDPLFAAIRTQANFLEITPWALALGALTEINGARKSTLNYAFAILFFLRFWHAEGGLMVRSRHGTGRFVGYWGTLIWLTAMSIFNFNLAIPVWSWN